VLTCCRPLGAAEHCSSLGLLWAGLSSVDWALLVIKSAVIKSIRSPGSGLLLLSSSTLADPTLLVSSRSEVVKVVSGVGKSSGVQRSGVADSMRDVGQEMSSKCSETVELALDVRSQEP